MNIDMFFNHDDNHQMENFHVFYRLSAILVVVILKTFFAYFTFTYDWYFFENSNPRQHQYA